MFYTHLAAVMKRFHIFLLPFYLSCAPVFTAEISGYVLDAQTYEGIPGVELRFYRNKPDNFADTRYQYQTSTGNDNNVGLFAQTVIWNDYLAQFGEDGDIIDMHFTIIHSQYQSKIESAIGIVSNASNTVPTILLSSLNASVDRLQGSVSTSEMLMNDVQVSLYLGEEDLPYARTSTETINGLDGQYLFEDINWRDPTLSGVTNAKVRIEDPRYTNPVPSEVTQELFDQQSTEVLPEIIVEIARPQTFRADISGETSFLIETKSNAEYRPISGIEIILEWFYDDENQSIPKSAVVRTDEDGHFFTTISWQDPIPDEDNSIPIGEDALDVVISYPSGGSFGFSYNLTSYNDTYTIRSWIENTLPSAYEYVPLPDEE